MSVALATPTAHEQPQKGETLTQSADASALVRSLVTSLQSCAQLAQSLENYTIANQLLSNFRAACIVIQHKIQLWDRLEWFVGDPVVFHGRKTKDIIVNILDLLKKLKERYEFYSSGQSHLLFHKIISIAKDELANSVGILEQLQSHSSRHPNQQTFWWALATTLLDPQDGLEPSALRQVKNDELLRKILGDAFITYFSALVDLSIALHNRSEPAPMSYEEGVVDHSRLQFLSSTSNERRTIAVHRRADHDVPVIVEPFNTKKGFVSPLHNIIKLLQLYKPKDMRVLPLVGFSERDVKAQNKGETRVTTFILKAPSQLLRGDQKMRSLSHLFELNFVPPGRQRVQLAMYLAVALLHFHLVGWTHGEVTTENILVLTTSSEEENGSYSISEFYLSGFRADGNWFRFAIPAGIVEPPNMELQKDPTGRAHDIDSFGWVLLELYLWQQMSDEKWKGQQIALSGDTLECYSTAFEKCVSGDIARQKPIENDGKRGFFWSVVQPLKECYHKLSPTKKEPSVGTHGATTKGRFLKNTIEKLKLAKGHNRSKEVYHNASPNDEIGLQMKAFEQLDSNIAQQRSMGNWAKAEALQEQLEISISQAIANLDPSATIPVQMFCKHLEKQGRWHEAERLEIRLMETRIIRLGKRDPSVLHSMGGLASIYRKHGHIAEAQEWEIKLLEVCLEEGTKCSAIMIECLARIAKDCLDQRKVEDANNWLRQAVVVAEEEFGISDQRTLMYKSVLKLQSFMNWDIDTDTGLTARSTECPDGSRTDCLVVTNDDLLAVNSSLDDTSERIVYQITTTFSKVGWFIPPTLFIVHDNGEYKPKSDESPKPVFTRLKESGQRPRLVLRHIHSTERQLSLEERANLTASSDRDTPPNGPAIPTRKNEREPSPTSKPDKHAESTPSTVTSIPEKRMIFAVNADKSTLRLWHEELLPRLEGLLERLPPKLKSAPVSIDLLGIGSTRETSRPTIVVTCEASAVATTRALLKKKFVYNSAVFDLKVRKGSVRRSAGRRTRGRRMRSRRSNAFGSDASINRGFQQKPVAGASIGACLPEPGGDLPPASYGGCVLVDGQPYGMTVHHLLDPLSDDEESEDEDCVEDEEIEECPELDSSDEVSLIASSDVEGMPWNSDDEDEDNAAEDNDDIDIDMFELELDDDENVSDTDSVSSYGDVAGIDSEKGKHIIIKQPAWFDFEDENDPNLPVEEVDSCPALRLGTVYVSSGLRRVKKNGIKHEIDWALLAVEKERLEQRNLIRGGAKYCTRTQSTSDLEPWSVVPMSHLAEKRVHASGRTTGLQGGMISPAMSSLKLPERRTYCRSWHVIGNLGHPGDSGSWVIDNDEGGVCGHVIARCSVRQCTYIAPMELMLEDLKKTLNATSVELPIPPSKKINKLPVQPVDTITSRPRTEESYSLKITRPNTTAVAASASAQQLAHSLVRQKDKVMQEMELTRPTTMV